MRCRLDDRVPMPPLAKSLPSAGITANLDNDSREVLGSHGTFHVAPAGTVLITQGKQHGRLFCVISGTFEARRRNDSDEVLLGTINCGEWIGEVDIFDPSSAMCSVVASEPSHYWEITRERLEEFLNTHHAAGIVLMIGLASTLGRRIRGITQKLAEQSERPLKTAAKEPEFDESNLRSAADLAAAFLRQKDYGRK